MDQGCVRVRAWGMCGYSLFDNPEESKRAIVAAAYLGDMIAWRHERPRLYIPSYKRLLHEVRHVMMDAWVRWPVNIDASRSAITQASVDLKSVPARLLAFPADDDMPMGAARQQLADDLGELIEIVLNKARGMVRGLPVEIEHIGTMPRPFETKKPPAALG